MAVLKALQLDNIADSNNHKKISNEENDTIIIDNRSFVRCLFDNLGLKHAVITDTKITQSSLSFCYFRHADLNNVDFTGSRFIGCDFEKAKLKLCNFRYCSFTNCRFDINELISNLPAETNLRKSILSELRCNQLSIGDKIGADRLLLMEIDSERKLWWEEFLLRSSYFREHARPWGRVNALFCLLRSYFLTMIWGHGLRCKNIIFSAIFIVLMFSLMLYGIGQLSSSGECYNQKTCFMQAFFLSASCFSTLGFSDILPNSIIVRIILCTEGFLGAIFIAMLGAALYRKIAR